LSGYLLLRRLGFSLVNALAIVKSLTYLKSSEGKNLNSIQTSIVLFV